MTVYAPGGGGSSVLGSTLSASPFDTFIGYQTGTSETTGVSNTLIGYQAGTAVTTGTSEVFVGYQAGLSVATGGMDTFVGAQAGTTQTAGNATTTGGNQVCIGFQAGQSSATQRNDVVAIGWRALVNGNNAVAVGSGTAALAAGAVAIGKDSGGASAVTSVANEIKLGTALHTVTIIGKTKSAAQARTSGALPTVQLVSPNGAQIDTTADRETITAVTFNPSAGASATALVEVSPDNATYTAVGTWTIPAGVTFDGTIELISVAIPAGWYLRVTTTNAVLGLTTYY